METKFKTCEKCKDNRPILQIFKHEGKYLCSDCVIVEETKKRMKEMIKDNRYEICDITNATKLAEKTCCPLGTAKRIIKEEEERKRKEQRIEEEKKKWKNKKR